MLYMFDKGDKFWPIENNKLVFVISKKNLSFQTMKLIHAIS